MPPLLECEGTTPIVTVGFGDTVFGQWTHGRRSLRERTLPAGQVGAMGEKEMKQDYIPKKYNDQSELSMEIKAGTNSQNFELVSK